MSLWQTKLKTHKLKLDKWTRKLALDDPWPGDRDAFCRNHGLDTWSDALGTIGGGNHFAELQSVEAIIEPEFADQLGLAPKLAQLMVHSGSRGLGQAVLRAHTERFGAAGIPDDDPAAAEYLRRHDDAIAFARANRALIARRFLDAVGSNGHCLADDPHNFVSLTADGWLHRKGAAPATGPVALVPGSRGSFSYVVRPLRNDRSHCWSLAHGAGRRWQRSGAKARLKNRYRVENLQKTALGSRVICSNRDLLYEEAPEAYKDVASVIDDMVRANLIAVVAILRPLLTYKVSGSHQ